MITAFFPFFFFSFELPSYNEFLDFFLKVLYICIQNVAIWAIYMCVNTHIHTYLHLGCVCVYMCVSRKTHRKYCLQETKQTSYNVQ